MKKIALLFVVILSVTLLFAACTPSYGWGDAEKDIETLKAAGFTVYTENTEEELKDFNNSLNYQLTSDDKDFSVELINVCCLVINKYDIISFEEYKTEKQAKDMYDYYHEVGSIQKLVRFGKIIISTNAQEAIELLGYDFK